MNELIFNLPLVIFIIFLINYFVGGLFIVYHLLKFGLDYKTKILALIFSAGSALLISLNFYLFSKIQWLEIPKIFEYLNIQIY